MKVKCVPVKYFKNCTREKPKGAREKPIQILKAPFFEWVFFVIMLVKIIIYRFFGYFSEILIVKTDPSR